MKIIIASGAACTCGCLLLSTVCGTQLWSADDKAMPFRNLLLGVASAPAPKVTEDSKEKSTGLITSYDWKDGANTGTQVSVTGLFGQMRSAGNWEYGASLNFFQADITPKSYEVQHSAYLATSGNTFHYRTLGVCVLGGYQYGLTYLNDFRGFVEITPFVGGGIAWADNEVHTASSTYLTETGTGPYWEYGLRAGAYITERRFIYGISLGLTGGNAKVTMDFPGYESELSLNRLGFSFGVVAGYRF
jgi:hypothetical protein